MELDTLLVKITDFLEPSYLVDVFALIFAYAFLIIGEIGFYRSITRRIYLGKLGNARFILF